MQCVREAGAKRCLFTVFEAPDGFAGVVQASEPVWCFPVELAFVPACLFCGFACSVCDGDQAGLELTT